jgi:CheY-like chemotaxis protein
MNKVGLVWVVDDDKLYQFTMQKTVDKTYLVDKFASFLDGKMAIDALTTYQNDPAQIPDIIFLDINMPVMDGWEFLTKYLQMKPSLAKLSMIYVVSSSIDTSDKAKARNIEGIADILVKPISKERFADLLQKHLDTH